MCVTWPIREGRFHHVSPWFFKRRATQKFQFPSFQHGRIYLSLKKFILLRILWSNQVPTISAFPAVFTVYVRLRALTCAYIYARARAYIYCISLFPLLLFIYLFSRLLLAIMPKKHSSMKSKQIPSGIKQRHSKTSDSASGTRLDFHGRGWDFRERSWDFRGRY